jgi:hypothetical protein
VYQANIAELLKIKHMEKVRGLNATLEIRRVEPVSCPRSFDNSHVLFVKLIVTYLLKKFTIFYGIQEFITVFTRSATVTYSNQDESSVNPNTLFLYYQFQYYPSIYYWFSQLVSSLKVL